MKYDRFEDLPVWKAAMDLAERVYVLTRAGLFAPPGDLGDQLRRAALSVSDNIAEGFESGTTAALLSYLYIARGSAGEARSQLRFAARLAARPEFAGANLKSEISDLIKLAESCSRQLRGWADSLQNSDIKGQRHLNDQTRAAYDARRRAEEFQAKLDEMNRQRLARWSEETRPKDPGQPPPESQSEI